MSINQQKKHIVFCIHQHRDKGRWKKSLPISKFCMLFNIHLNKEGIYFDLMKKVLFKHNFFPFPIRYHDFDTEGNLRFFNSFLDEKDAS